MTTYKHSLWSTPTLLIVAVMVTVGAGVPTIAAQAAATTPKVNKVDNEVKVRMEEERRLKKKDKSYTQHAKALADQCAETAKLVASHGGNPKALHDAAAYYDQQSSK